MLEEVNVEEIPEEEKQRIKKALEDKGATLPCPRCGNNSFTLLGGYFNQPIQPNLQGLVLGGRSVPMAVVVCNRCGYLSLHALGALGLLQQDE